ncbi:dihydrolipoyl dehydrogenase family protein [Nitratireductor basaltis]|uniref:Pyridine nucleotide-disulfide oxidoreductase dimerization subunit n=1 Tax=Nitratireductor basaltis TaxID=472175 RepID=A0A084UDH1_9HYPH|nr:FAD-dependent oxidoreductase [Nitratireductor basaltis]KFB11007.1 Pyridine nucleotide-disulfide oxidoreductase dimerization subunit [Nitratireductor basaltis]
MSDTVLKPDICVIGAGSGGLTVAAAAAQFGVSVVLIERHKMGGDCLNYGCVPSKALLAAGKHAQAMRNGASFGIANADPDVDFAAVMAHVHDVIAAIAPNDSVERFTSLGVQVIEEEARFVDERMVQAGPHKIRARRFVIATGSSPMVPPIEGLDEVEYFTNETIFSRSTLPEHLIIAGGGPIGLEMAQAHRRLGARVTVVEADKALGKDDPEMARLLIDRLKAEGIDIREHTKVARLEKRDEGQIRVHVSGAEGDAAIDGSTLLVATGRRPNLQALDLEKAGVEHDRSGVKVNDKLRSTNSRVYAIGDAAGGLQFTHVANYHAGLVIRAILFRLPAREKRHILPWVTYTDPELAHIGLTEDQARDEGKLNKVLRWPYAENDRAQAERKTTGLIKIVTGKGGRIIGVTILGAGAGEMMNMWALAIAKGLKVSDITGYVAPYPTMSEIGKRAAISYYSDKTGSPVVRGLIRFLRLFG